MQIDTLTKNIQGERPITGVNVKLLHFSNIADGSINGRVSRISPETIEFGTEKQLPTDRDYELVNLVGASSNPQFIQWISTEGLSCAAICPL